MSDQKDQQQGKLEKWFGPDQTEQRNAMSDTSESTSLLSIASFSSLSRKYRIRNASDVSISTSIWGSDDVSASPNLKRGSECSSSSSSIYVQKDGKVTSDSSSFVSSRKSCDKDDSSVPLLHVHKSRRKKKPDSTDTSSITKRNDNSGASCSDTSDKDDSSSSLNPFKHRGLAMGHFVSGTEGDNDAGSSSSDNITSEKDESSSSSPNLFKLQGSAIGHCVSTTEQENDSASSSSGNNTSEKDVSTSERENDSASSTSDNSENDRQLTSLKNAQKRGRERADMEQNDCVSSLPSHNSEILKHSSSINHDVDNKIFPKKLDSTVSSLSLSSDSKQEQYASSTSSAPSETSEHRNKKRKNVSNDVSGAQVSSSNRPKPAKSHDKNAKRKHKKKTTDSSMESCTASSSSMSCNKRLKAAVSSTSASTTTTPDTPLSSSPSHSTVNKKAASNSLESAIDSITYRDYSHITPEAAHYDMVNVNKVRTLLRKDAPFPQKVHQILSNPEYKEWITWLPHGRAWKILDQDEVAKNVLPRFFQHGKLSSFMRQVSNWGFKRVHSGPDKNSYYHEFFLRGLPHVAMKMKRHAVKSKEPSQSFISMFRSVAPDFYQISKEHPLPDENGVLLPSIAAEPLPCSSSSNIVPQASNKSEHVDNKYTTEVSTNPSIATEISVRNAVGATSSMPDVVASTQDVKTQQFACTMPKDNSSIKIGGFPLDTGQGNTSQTLPEDGGKESRTEQQLHPGNIFFPVNAAHSHIFSNMSTPRTDVSFTGPFFPAHTILLNVQQLAQHQQNATNRFILPGLGRGRGTSVGEDISYSRLLSLSRQMAEQRSAEERIGYASNGLVSEPSGNDGDNSDGSSIQPNGQAPKRSRNGRYHG